jgi:hypothetical protein
MSVLKEPARTPRFGVALSIRYKKYLHEQAAKTHRSPVKYIEMLLDEDKKRKRNDDA